MLATEAVKLSTDASSLGLQARPTGTWRGKVSSSPALGATAYDSLMPHSAADATQLSMFCDQPKPAFVAGGGSGLGAGTLGGMCVGHSC